MEKQQLIMVPGWGMPSDIWSPFIGNLSAYFDLSPVDWSDVETIDGFYQKGLATVFAKQNQSVSILGWSLGALVALDIAAEHSERIARVILFGGTSRFTSDKPGGYGEGWPTKVVEKMKAALEKDRENTLCEFYRAMFSQEEGEEQARRFMGLYGRRFLNQPLPSLLSGLDYLIQTDCRGQLHRIKAPLLLIHGAHDRICPVQAAEYIRSQVAVKTWFRVLPEAGHMPFFTYPAQCLRDIEGFIDLGGGPHD